MFPEHGYMSLFSRQLLAMAVSSWVFCKASCVETVPCFTAVSGNCFFSPSKLTQGILELIFLQSEILRAYNLKAVFQLVQETLALSTELYHSAKARRRKGISKGKRRKYNPFP